MNTSTSSGSASGRGGQAANVVGASVVTDAMKNFENVHNNYVAIINPSTGRAMLHLKKYGDCTLIDPRACIHHQHCAADVACVLYAPVSLRYFHYMVHSGYVSNKTRVVLHDTTHDTFVNVVVQNRQRTNDNQDNTVEAIIRNVQRHDGQYRVGIDVLQPGDAREVGYYFHLPKSSLRLRNNDKIRTTSAKILTREEWDKRVQDEKQKFECHRRHHNECMKEDLSIGCRRTAALRGAGAAASTGAVAGDVVGFSSILHIPTLIIEHPAFNLVPAGK